MAKVVRVLVAGVPVVSLPTQAWRKKATFKIGGKKPQPPSSKLYESFAPGATKELRKRFVREFQASLEFSQRNMKVEAEDFGEVLPDQPIRAFEGQIGLDEGEMAGLAQGFAEACEGFDLAIILGGNHAGGFLLYALPGKVARFDEHSDSCETPDTCNPGVARNSYVCAAIRNGLKSADEIVGVGVRQGKSPYEIASRAEGCSVFDVDVDVFAQKYGIKSAYGKGALSPDALVGAIRANKPKAMGFFEMVEGDEKAFELIVQLSIEAAIAIVKK